MWSCRDRDRQGAGSRAAGHGDAHGHVLHSVPDHLASLEGRPNETHPVLADRNVLIEQAMVNDFRAFGGTMAKLSTNAKTIERQDGSTEELVLALNRKRRIDTAYEVHLGLYPAITGPEERQTLFREFSPGFFNLMVIDELPPWQRRRGLGLARDPRILLHRPSQIGLTATPKETKYVSDIVYSAIRCSPTPSSKASAMPSLHPTRW